MGIYNELFQKSGGLWQIFLSTFNKIIVNGSNSLFWNNKDAGGGVTLKDRFPRLYALEKEKKKAKFKDRWSFNNGSWIGSWDWRSDLRGRSIGSLNDMEAFLSNNQFNVSGQDKWIWSGDKHSVFSVNQMVNLLKASHQGREDGVFRWFWCNLIPIKTNIFLWRFLRDALLTRLNLNKRGISLTYLNCIFCNNNEESLDHCFFTCHAVSNV